MTVREALEAPVPEWFLGLHVIVAALLVVAGILVIITSIWILNTIVDYVIFRPSTTDRVRQVEALLGCFITDTGLFLLKGVDVLELLDERKKRDVRFLVRQGLIEICGNKVFLTPAGFELLHGFQEEGTRDEQLIEEAKDALRGCMDMEVIRMITELEPIRTEAVARLKEMNSDQVDKAVDLRRNIVPDHLERILCEPKLAVAMDAHRLIRIGLENAERKAACGDVVGLTVLPVTVAGLGAAGGFAATTGADTLVAAAGIGGGALTGYLLGKLAGKGRLWLRARRSRQAYIVELVREEIVAAQQKDQPPR